MSNKLSHSSVNKFSDCPTAWRLHYVERLRGTTQSAALLFGTAIDKAVEDLVLTRNLEDAKKTFLAYWTSAEINGVNTELKTMPDLVYAANDMDIELLDTSLDPIFFNKDIIENIEQKKKEVGFNNLPLGDKVFYNTINWYIAKKRGELMLEAVNNEILPKLKRVHSTQERIDLTNDTGDSVVGYVDLVADYVGYDAPIIFDFKTSTRAYEQDSVKVSPQLALYVHALSEKYKTRTAGFIVLSKQIQKNRKKICSVCGNDGTGGRHKTCDAMVLKPAKFTKEERCNGAWVETINPKAKIDVIIDEIPEQLENIVLENMDSVNKMLSNGIFTRNLNSCVKPYGKCVYYDKCYNNSDKGLIKV